MLLLHPIEGGTEILFQVRTNRVRFHKGEISLPGGAIDPEDASERHAALRETHEEIGLARGFIQPIGAWDRYDTITGYRVTPIAALVEPGFELKLDPREVASVFEAPLDFLMNPANHEVREAQWQGRTRYYYAMPYDGHNIWGATAGMIRALYERLHA